MKTILVFDYKRYVNLLHDSLIKLFRSVSGDVLFPERRVKGQHEDYETKVSGICYV